MDSFERVKCRIEYQIVKENLDCEGRSVVKETPLSAFSTRGAAEQASANAGYSKSDKNGDVWEKRSDFSRLVITRVLVEER